MGTPENDWEKALLELARKIYKQGEGEIVFKVRTQQDIPEVIISGGETQRFKKRLDKVGKMK